MFRRMLLALLIACLAVPAMAAGCHGVSIRNKAHHEHHAKGDSLTPFGLSLSKPRPYSQGSTALRQAQSERERDAVLARHDCIGCIPPLHGLAQIETLKLLPEIPIADAAASLNSRPLIPDPPPPRSFV